MKKRTKPNKSLKFQKFDVNFKVEHIDSIGQGVSKLEDKITFIQKCLPNEEGVAEVYKAKKNIQFAKLKHIDKASPIREESKCPYFNECGGCHFLHTSYDDELEFKRQAFLDNFSRQYKIDLSQLLKVHKASERYQYRNRIQLHYNKKTNSLGFFNEDNTKIISIDKCLMANENVNNALFSLKENWQKEANRPKGHVEIFERDGKVLKTYDSRYSAQGFLQVNPPMNQRLLELIEGHMRQFTDSNSTTVDLFGGNGNLTKSLNHRSIVIDATPAKYIKLQNQKTQEYHEVDIYNSSAIEQLKKLNVEEVDLLVIDPPRSGLKNIDEYTKLFKPKYIIYVSCNNQTLARDTAKILAEYDVQEAHLFDFFPGTRHFESVNIFKHRKAL
ncbi:class I SAM-dependent RNA methyltransferase [Halobacteriovorax sp. DPLXC-1]|uniref:class I SAM-dependent RNA methyltransferase n=1 Tax=Halobacteriovorax sp. DPLXC-1 TaxID=3110771 RepID=UPI002FEEB6F2